MNTSIIYKSARQAFAVSPKFIFTSKCRPRIIFSSELPCSPLLSIPKSILRDMKTLPKEKKNEGGSVDRKAIGESSHDNLCT